MKRVGHLIEEISSLENLLLAFYKAKKGKEHKAEIVQYSKNLKGNLKLLQQQIETGGVEVGRYHYFKIYDPKERLICAASFSERVLHHAIMNICHDIFDKKLIHDTYATRINKGTYKALEKAKLNTKKSKYFIKFDIRKYFDSINHDIMKQILNRLFKDRQLLHIFDKIIDSYRVTPNRGLPIGNLTSQYFANIYLGQLDNYVKHHLRIKSYVRYMDDFIVWTNSKAAVKTYGTQIADFIEAELDLQLKIFYSNKTTQGISFLSYRLFPDKILLGKKAKKRFRANVQKLMDLLENQLITQEEYALRVRAYTAFASKAYSKKYRTTVFKF